MGRFKRHIKVSRHHWKTHKDDEIFMPSSSDDPLVDMIQDGCTEIRSCNVGIRDLSDDPKIDLTLTRRSKRFRKSGVDDQVELDNDRIILNRPGSVVKRSSRVKIDEIDLDPETKYTDDDLGAVVIIKEVLSKNQLMEVVHRPPILAPASKSSSSQGLINENIIVDLTEDSQILDNVPSIVIDTSSVVEVTGSVKMRKSETRCLVCLDDFSHPASVRCGHVFCEACIRMAVHSTKKCPACRKPVKKQDIRRLYMQATFDLHPMGLPPQEILDELELRRIYERLSSHYSTQKQMEPSQVNRHLAQWDSASGNCHLRNFISQQPSPPANFDSTLKLIDKAMDLTPGPIPGFDVRPWIGTPGFPTSAESTTESSAARKRISSDNLDDLDDITSEVDATNLLRDRSLPDRPVTPLSAPIIAKKPRTQTIVHSSFHSTR